MTTINSDGSTSGAGRTGGSTGDEGRWRILIPRWTEQGSHIGVLLADGSATPGTAPKVEFHTPTLLGWSAISLQLKTDGRCTIRWRSLDPRIEAPAEPIPAVTPAKNVDGAVEIPGTGVRMVVNTTAASGILGTTIFGAEAGIIVQVEGEVGVTLDPRCRVFIPVGQ